MQRRLGIVLVMAPDSNRRARCLQDRPKRISRSFPFRSYRMPSSEVVRSRRSSRTWSLLAMVASRNQSRCMVSIARLSGRTVSTPRLGTKESRPGWVGFDFAAALRRPVRTINDAACLPLPDRSYPPTVSPPSNVSTSPVT